MNSHDISDAKNPDLRASLAALRRASHMARVTAMKTGTNIVIVKDGQMVRIPAEELRRRVEATIHNR